MESRAEAVLMFLGMHWQVAVGIAQVCRDQLEVKDTSFWPITIQLPFFIPGLALRGRPCSTGTESR